MRGGGRLFIVCFVLFSLSLLLFFGFTSLWFYFSLFSFLFVFVFFSFVFF